MRFEAWAVGVEMIAKPRPRVQVMRSKALLVWCVRLGIEIPPTELIFGAVYTLL